MKQDRARVISPLTSLILKFFFDTKRSQQSRSLRKAVPKTFGIFTGKPLCWSFILIKLQAFRTAGIEITDFQMPDKTTDTIKYLPGILKIHRP